MLKTAFNLVSRDFNRNRVAVWHVVEIDDAEYQSKEIIRKWRLLCGDKRIEPSLQDGFVTIDELTNGSYLPEGDEACGRCLRSLRAKKQKESQKS